MSSFIRTGLIWSMVLVSSMVAITLVASQALPEGARVPVHWGLDGLPDRFTDRSGATALLWLMPGIGLITALVVAGAALIDPRKENLYRGRKAYLISWLGAMVLLTLVHAGIAFMITRDNAETLASPQFVRWVVAGCALLFIVIGNYIPKTRSSFMLGIRTPWTLSSETAWEKTHRLAGRLFILAGSLGLVGAFVFDGVWLAVQLTTLVITAALISIVYSYFAWRNAGDKDEGGSFIV